MRVALPTCRSLPDWEVDDVPLHEALAEFGHEVVRPVWDDDSVDWAGFGACLIRTTWDYPDKRELFVAWADRVARHTTLYNASNVVRWGTHKRYLLDLQGLGAPIAPTVWLNARQSVDVAELLRRNGWTKAILKPAIGATSRETLRFGADLCGIRHAEAHLARMLGTEEMLLQPYYRSVETRGETSVIFIDGVFSHAVRKVPVPGDYRVQDDFGASDCPVVLTPSEATLACRCVEMAEALLATSLLYARVDLLYDDGGEARLNELEVVDPSLFFRHSREAARTLASALDRRLRT